MIDKSEITLQGQIVDKLKLKALLLCLLVHGGACLDPEEPGTFSPHTCLQSECGQPLPYNFHYQISLKTK